MLTIMSTTEARERRHTFRSAEPRGHVIIIATTPELEDPETWRTGVDIGATHIVTLPDAQDWLMQQVRDLMPAGTYVTPEHLATL